MADGSSSRPARLIAPGTQTASFWIDESGSKSTSNNCFVMGCVKTRHPDDLQRAVQAVRDRHDHRDELKFGRIKSANYSVFTDLIDTLEASDAHICATVVDGTTIHNPFRGGDEVWKVHSRIAAQLILGNLNRSEIATVFLDVVNTPEGVSMGGLVKRAVNASLKVPSVVSAVSLNSKSNDVLQLADLVAGSVFYERLGRPASEQMNEHKVKVAKRLALAFGVDNLSDGRSKRVNIVTLKAPRKSRLGQRSDPHKRTGGL